MDRVCSDQSAIHVVVTLNPALWKALKKSNPTEDRGIIFPHNLAHSILGSNIITNLTELHHLK